jgi:hypothetical protein
MENVNTVMDVEPAIVKASDYGSREWAERRFFEDIERTRKSAEEYGWISQEGVEREFGYGVEE